MKNRFDNLLSVVIPVYNVEAYLDKCLMSVTRQTYKELQIILINDGSTDGSGDICKKWADRDSRILYIDKENEGSGPTRNLGIDKAVGKYITFIDSDDWWDIHYAENMISAINEADIAICDMVYVDVDEKGNAHQHISNIRITPGVYEEPFKNQDLINRARTFLCGKVFKRSLFTENRIRQPNLAINDYPIVCLLVAKASKICRVDKPLYYYLRNRPGNTVTSIKSLWSFGEALEILKRNFETGNLIHHFQRALYKMYYSQVRFALKKGREGLKRGLPQEQYNKLEEYLFSFLDSAWPTHPDINNKKFGTDNNDVLGEAIKLVLFDDSMLVDPDECDYFVTSDHNAKGKPDAINVVVNIDTALKGEDLLWDIADQILFLLERRENRDV
jgi:glycosyltransferase involved in cell wall biosynthesis